MLRGSNLPPTRDGRRVRVAKMLSARQRPGTAKGFVFALEDEIGLASVIVRFDLFNGQRMASSVNCTCSWTGCCCTRTVYDQSGLSACSESMGACVWTRTTD